MFRRHLRHPQEAQAASVQQWVSQTVTKIVYQNNKTVIFIAEFPLNIVKQMCVAML
jgi:hypothetical protein